MVVCVVFGGVGDGGVRERGPSVYGCFYVSMFSVYVDVKIVQSIVFFRFCCEL